MTRPPSDASLDEALALGGTRVASLAHPHCLCGKRKPPLLPEPPSSSDAPALQEWIRLRHDWGSSLFYHRQNCPVHAGTAGGA